MWLFGWRVCVSCRFYSGPEGWCLTTQPNATTTWRITRYMAFFVEENVKRKPCLLSHWISYTVGSSWGNVIVYDQPRMYSIMLSKNNTDLNNISGTNLFDDLFVLWIFPFQVCNWMIYYFFHFIFFHFRRINVACKIYIKIKNIYFMLLI